MNEAKQAKYILWTFAARNRTADSSGHHSAPVHRLKSTRPSMISNGYSNVGKHVTPEDKCTLMLGGTSRNRHWRRRIGIKAPIVNAEISAKLAAFAAALTMNGLLAAGMAYLFNAPLERHTTPLEQHAAGIADSGADKPQYVDLTS